MTTTHNERLYGPKKDWRKVASNLEAQDQTQMKQLFRLELDENGEADATDFTEYAPAMAAYLKAKKRQSVFSARLDLYDEETHEKQTTVVRFERD
jgi:hypothetical protein